VPREPRLRGLTSLPQKTWRPGGRRGSSRTVVVTCWTPRRSLSLRASSAICWRTRAALNRGQPLRLRGAERAAPAGSCRDGDRNWCNPTGEGLGIPTTADTGVELSSLDTYLPGNPPLLDAYLWIKTPGQSDGQCDAAGGVRNWDDASYTSPIPNWPSNTSADFQTFDPL
jgi:hypothetical protein